MLNQRLNIIEFIKHPEILNDQRMSVAQQTFLKATYGLPLNSEEHDIYQRSTGRSEEVLVEQNEETLIAGRRAGKDMTAAWIAIYEAFRDHNLSRGDRGYVMLIAPTKRQARIAMRYILANLRSSPLLWRCVAEVRRDEIELSHGVTIACYPCSHVAVRGVSIICCICDELAFWRHEETAASPEEEVLAALRPAMASFPTAKLIKISTPYRKEGIVWREFQQRGELNHLVWQMPSWVMNPTLSPSFLEKEKKRSEEQFRREYGAEFTDQIAAWIVPEVLDPCIVRNRTELPRVQNATYVVAIDPAFRNSDFALAILHRTNEGLVVVDRVAHWTGTKKAPLSFEWVCREVARIIEPYGIREVVGDQYCFSPIKQHFDEKGIRYREYTFAAHTRMELFGTLSALLTERKIELLDEPTLLRQLRALELRTGRNNLDIRPSHDQKDDVAVAVALAAFELCKRPPRREPGHIRVISVSRRQSSFDRGEGGWTPIGEW